jgi:lysyl-tRNA synthetase class 2
MRDQGYDVDPNMNWAKLVDELISKHVEPTITHPTFLMDYPIELSPFAKLHAKDTRLTERFELVVQGMEVANAFTELQDPRDQRTRLEKQHEQKERGDDEAQPYDPGFIEALEYGMPPTGGIGIGIDRLMMLLTKQKTIREVVLFPALK